MTGQALAHLLLTHRHGVDEIVELLRGDGCPATELFAAVFADEEDCEFSTEDMKVASNLGLISTIEQKIEAIGVVGYEVVSSCTVEYENYLDISFEECFASRTEQGHLSPKREIVYARREDIKLSRDGLTSSCGRCYAEREDK